jgi:hypothetical protein
MTYRPIPSKAKTAVPISKGNESLLKSTTSATPYLDITLVSLTPIYITKIGTALAHIVWMETTDTYDRSV